MRIVVIGEVLWDVFEDSEKLGGASFNFAVHASRLGHEVTFVSAVGDDQRGRAVLARAANSAWYRLHPDRSRSADRHGLGSRRFRRSTGFHIHRPAAYDALHLDRADLQRLAAIEPDWLYYGTLHQAEPAARAETRKLVEALPGARRFYDVNLRRNSYTRELVAELMAAAHVVKLNDDEAVRIDSCPAGGMTRFPNSRNSGRANWDGPR